MKINKNTWHYRQWIRCGGSRYNSVSICGYIQRLFWVSLLYATVVGIVLTIAVYDFVMAFIHHPLVVSITLGGGLAFIAIVYGVIHYFFVRYSYDDDKPVKKPSLFVEWFRAKKQKVCPLVEFEE